MPDASPMTSPSIHWFRRDLRLSDNPGLMASGGRPMVGVFIWEEDASQGGPDASARLVTAPADRPMGGAARWRLLQGLEALKATLDEAGIPLVTARGAPVPILVSIARSIGARTIRATSIPEPGALFRERETRTALAQQGLELVLRDGALLFPPPEDPVGESRVRRSFSGYARAARSAGWRIAPPVGRMSRQRESPAFVLPGRDHVPEITPLRATDLYRGAPDWAAGFDRADCGETAALTRWQHFLDRGLAHYAHSRDSLDGAGGSGLSAHLNLGEISVHRLWSDLAACADHPELVAGVEKFTSELLWREFSHHLLAHFPDMVEVPLEARFADFPFRKAPAEYDAWRHGQTGYPIVDALMRGLWRTGRMSNRGRMIAASFLIKHLLIDWRLGEAWFRDCLIDASAATNSFSWQWVAGCGTDAAPFFRIFNPVLQSEKFDPDGTFIRRFVPEVSVLPAPYIHRPWTAPAGVLTLAGVRLGRDYPLPMVDHGFARQRALAAFGSLRKSGG